jgi:hypothetical protein
MWLPDKDAAIEVDAEAEEGLDVAPVAVSVALKALQQDPATHANQSTNPTEQAAKEQLISLAGRPP